MTTSTNLGLTSSKSTQTSFPSSSSSDNHGAAFKAANLSFSPSPKSRTTPVAGSPSPNAALLAARHIGLQPTASSPTKTSSRRSSLVKANSFHHRSPERPTNGSLTAARLSVSRYNLHPAVAKPRRHSATQVHHSAQDDLFSSHTSHDLSGPVLAAKLSALAARNRSTESLSSDFGSSTKSSNVSLAASRLAAVNMSKNDQQEDVLPVKGSVLEAKRRLFHHAGHIHHASHKQTTQERQDTAYRAVTSDTIRKSFEAQRTEDVRRTSGSSALEAPIPVRLNNNIAAIHDASLNAAQLAIRRSPVQNPKSLPPPAGTKKPVLVRRNSPLKEVSKAYPEPPEVMNSQALRHSFDVTDRSVSSTIIGVNPPEWFAPPGDLTTTGKGKQRAAVSEKSQPPPLPAPRRTRKEEIFPASKGRPPLSSRVSSPATTTPRQPLPQPPLATTKHDIFSHSEMSTSTSALLLGCTPRPLPNLTRHFTGPEHSSTAASLAYQAGSTNNWRDDLGYLSIPLRPSNTGSSLQQAMVASSLASSRASSPSKTALEPPLRVQQGLKTTLRKPHKKEKQEISPSRAKKKHLVKHPHKHHEGTRQRWKEVITERERRRYEGLWAANRGLYLLDNNHATSLPEDLTMRDGVCSVVVRDVWSRSRLPFEVLENVWDLVDRTRQGWLTREEFIMGLWLIDQSLKGRKLPGKVQQETWESIHRLGVILKDYKELGIKKEQMRKGKK